MSFSAIRHFPNSLHSVIDTILNPPEQSNVEELNIVISEDMKKVLVQDTLQKLQGILSCERIPLAGRASFLKRLEADLENRPQFFYNQMGTLDVLRDQVLSKICVDRLTKEYKLHRTVGNGSCGWEALVMHFQDDGWTIADLRKAVANVTREKLDYLKTIEEVKGGFSDMFDLMTDDVLDDVKIENHIKKIENPATISDGWLTNREIAIFIHCMINAGINCIVEVYTSSEYHDEIGAYVPLVFDKTLDDESYDGDDEPLVIRMINSGYGHYDLLDVKPKPQESAELKIDQ